MRSYLTALLILFLTVNATAQSLTIKESGDTQNNSASTFTVNGTDISLSRGELSIEGSTDISTISRSVNINGLTAVLNNEGLSLVGGDGSTLYLTGYEFPAESDPSLKIYAMYDGGVVIRENITNFLIYDSFGKNIKAIKNNTGSQEGESISEIAADPYFKTIALYNPEYRMNGKSGSRVRVIRGTNMINSGATEVYNSEDRTIKTVKVSDNGQLLAVATTSGGSDDNVYISDRYGNQINSFDFDQEISGLAFSGDNKFITVYSTGRVVVYELLSGDRVGSTSLRTPVRTADYFPQDENIVLMTAGSSGSVHTDIEIRVINVGLRKIASEDFGQSLGYATEIPLRIKRVSKGSYRLEGLSRSLDIRATF